MVIDDLSEGFGDAVSSNDLIVGSITDADLLSSLFKTKKIAAVIHFASFIQVNESIKEPEKYYENNLVATLTLLEEMRKAEISCFIFSSTAAVYGNPQYTPINEDHPKNPINPYGRSKWMVEQVLEDYDRAYGLRSICFRYFNAAGADPDGELGERHDPETHLIPIILQVASGRRESVSIFGTDYDTPDGTCIRDYIHVCDLCEAHLLALKRLLKGGKSSRFNLGNGQGFSVNDVIETARRVTECDIPILYEPRRAGDPPRLVADATHAREELRWHPRRAKLETIIADAWAWEKTYMGNFGKV